MAIENAIIVRSAVNRLNENIREFNKKASRQTTVIIWLTVGMFILSLLMLIGLGLQVWIAMK